jgi:VanZ family protein
MTTQTQSDWSSSSSRFRWSLRIVVLAVAGIGLLTLYPFRLSLHRYPSLLSSFLLPGPVKTPTALDVFLNILLFLPYGFGATGLLQKRGIRRSVAWGLAWTAGFLLSYSVEFAQSLIPDRDSSWNDVLTNSIGSLIGSVLFGVVGISCLELLQKWEKGVIHLVSAKSVASALVIYFAIWLGLSAYLQRAAGLRDWDPLSYLSIAGVFHSQSSRTWNGQVYSVEFWNRELSDNDVSGLESVASSVPQNAGLISAYDFSGSAPFADLRHNSPALGWMTNANGMVSAPHHNWDGSSWLSTQVPATTLISDIAQSGRFSVYIRCATADIGKNVDASIVSISRGKRFSDMEIFQRASDLHVWFKTPASNESHELEWSIPGAFTAGEPTDFVATYDGARVHLYRNGHLSVTSFRLGPWAALAELVRHDAKADELGGYRYVFYCLIFFPAGCLLGLASRKWLAIAFVLPVLIVFGILLPSVLFELILVLAGDQPASLGAICLASFMSIAGFIWINLEDDPRTAVQAAPVQVPLR